MKRIIDRCQKRLIEKGIKEYEIYLIIQKNTTIDVKRGKVELFKVAESRGISLRLLKDKKIGFAYTTSLDEYALEKLIDHAKESLEGVSMDPYSVFPGPNTYPNLEIYDNALDKIPIKEKIEFAKEMEASALSYDSRIKRVRASQFQEKNIRVFIKNHKGVDAYYKKTILIGNILVVAEEKNEAEMGWEFEAQIYFNKLNPRNIGRRAGKWAIEALGGRSIPTQKVPLILINRVVIQFLEVLCQSFFADKVQKGKSLLAPYLGKMVMSPSVTIIDDGIIKGGIGSRPFDDEGVPQQRTILIKDGILKDFLYDSYTANKAGKQSTGNCVREKIELPPRVHITNLYLMKGDTSFSHLLKALNKGLVVTDILGMHTVDPISGDFSVGACGYWVEGGERRFSVKGIAISGNVLNIFKGVTLVGSDFLFLGNIGAPSMLIEETQISGS